VVLRHIILYTNVILIDMDYSPPIIDVNHSRADVYYTLYIYKYCTTPWPRVFSLIRFRSCCVTREYNNILKSPVCIRRDVLMLQVGRLGTKYHEKSAYTFVLYDVSNNNNKTRFSIGDVGCTSTILFFFLSYAHSVCFDGYLESARRL